MTDLDAIDLRILAALQEDARISMVDLADRAGLSETPCARRVRRLEADGIIRRYVTLLDAEKLGAGLTVIVNVRLRSQTKEAVEEFESAVLGLPEITACFLVTGDYDYVLHLRLPDIGAYKDFMRDRLIVNDAVAETSSAVALDQVKFTTAIPLPRPAAARR